MDVLIISALKDIILEAIRLLGPPLIGGVIGYMIAKQQLEKRIEEIKESNVFRARELLFKKGLQERKDLNKESEKLSGALGQLSALAAQMEYVDINPNNPIARPIFGLVNHSKNCLVLELIIIKRKLQKYSKPEETIRVEEYINIVSKLETANDYDELQKMILSQFDIYGYINYCQDLLLEEEAEKVIAKILD